MKSFVVSVCITDTPPPFCVCAQVLMLEGIKYKDGPKANSEAEVRMLELARRRNAIEAALPPTTDEASVVLRRMVLEELESDEFKARERDIDAFQEERLHALAVALAERDRAETFNSEVRVDLLRQRTRETFDKKRTATTQKRLSTLRKLDTARANALPARLMQGASSKGDTIQMMSKPSSTKFVALRREGASMDDKSAKFSIGRVVAAPESPEALVRHVGAEMTPALLNRTTLTPLVSPLSHDSGISQWRHPGVLDMRKYRSLALLRNDHVTRQQRGQR